MSDDVTNTLPLDLGLRSLMKLNKKFVKKKEKFLEIHGLEVQDSMELFSHRENNENIYDLDVDSVNPILPYNKKTLNKIFGVVPIKDDIKSNFD